MEKKEISTLFRQYYGRMYGMAVSILYDEQESKDVVSDIFERLLESDTVLLPDTVEHYLLTSVRNSCLKRISQKTNRQRIAMLYASEQQMAASPEEDELPVGADAAFCQDPSHPTTAVHFQDAIPGRDEVWRDRRGTGYQPSGSLETSFQHYEDD